MALCPGFDFISICTGGGGLDLGIDLAIPCARPVVMVEREAFAAAHLVAAMQQGLLAQAPVWSDARTFDGRRWRGCVDGLIGGIPCQPHSLAGKKRGQHDERDLWSDARRIIVQSRPWFVLIENVAGMLSAGADEIAGAERVWRDLRKLGFAVEGGLFTAAEVGASHQRLRTFILGVADRNSEHSDGRWIERAGWRGQPANRRGDVADASGARPQGRELGGPSGERDGSEAPRSTPELCGAPMADANAGSPQIREGAAAIRGRRPEQPTGDRAAGRDADHLDDTSVARGRAVPIQQGRQDEADRYAYRPSLFPPGPTDLSGWRAVLDRAPELEPAFRRVADGLASRLDIARVDRLRMLGNGVVPLQAAYAIRTLSDRLKARGVHVPW